MDVHCKCSTLFSLIFFYHYRKYFFCFYDGVAQLIYTMRQTILWYIEHLIYCVWRGQQPRLEPHCKMDCIKVNVPTVTSLSSAAGHEASEGNGAAGEKPERTVRETWEVQWAGTTANKSNHSRLIYLQSNSLLAAVLHLNYRNTWQHLLDTSCIRQSITQFLVVCFSGFLSVNETQDKELVPQLISSPDNGCSLYDLCCRM